VVPVAKNRKPTKKKKKRRAAVVRPSAAVVLSKRFKAPVPAADTPVSDAAPSPESVGLECKYSLTPEEGEDQADTLQVGDLVVAFDEDESRHHPVRILSRSVDHLGPTYETHIYGTYTTKKGLHDSKYLPAYVDPKDGKLLFTASPAPRLEPWRWQVGPEDVCSQPFVLKRSHVPRGVQLQCQH
jgi:hypothetical protein